LASVLTIISTLVFNLFFPENVTTAVYFVPALYAVISILWIKILQNPKFEAISKFSNIYMLTTMVKLFVYLAFFVVFYLASGKNKAFAMDYMAVYLVFAVTDTAVIMKKSDKK
jgi:hypothetical protein